ncbi:hypothetical protein [Micromonospora sp. NPDC023737]|uniref:hypothetical protein n=1 Tax=unclassified Micromonospora TaxID=2617518 RepID=UPI0033C58437
MAAAELLLTMARARPVATHTLTTSKKPIVVSAVVAASTSAASRAALMVATSWGAKAVVARSSSSGRPGRAVRWASRSHGLATGWCQLAGLRPWGELAALRVRRVDLVKRRLLVAESVTEVNGRAVFGTPKTHQRRSVPLPRFLVEPMAA